MRVISGKFKKKEILLPDQNFTRPLRDYVKENIFNLLTHSKLINFNFQNSLILDLFSGSGSFGLECLSRGSEKIFFCEKEKDVLNILKKNIYNFSVKDQSKIFFMDVLKINFKNEFKHEINLIFLDPPFKYTNLEKLFEKLKIFSSNTLIIFHIEKGNLFNFNIYLDVLIYKIYGRSVIVFGKIKS